MDGFKNSTKTQYMKGGSVGERKIGRVMEEFTKGKLHSGSKEGPKVKSTKQAVAIALNEARAAGAKIPRVKKADGGGVFNEKGKRMTWDEVAAEGRRMEGRKPPVEGISTRPTDDSGRRMTDAELGLTGSAKKPMPKGSGIMPAALAASKKAAGMMKKGVPAHSDRPMIRRSKGGLSAMPKGKC